MRAKRSCRDVEMCSIKCNSSQDEVGMCTSRGSLWDTFATGQRLCYRAAVSSPITPAAPGPCQLLGLPLLHEGTALRSSLSPWHLAQGLGALGPAALHGQMFRASLQYSCRSLYISWLPPAFQCFHLYECRNLPAHREKVFPGESLSRCRPVQSWHVTGVFHPVSISRTAACPGWAASACGAASGDL